MTQLVVEDLGDEVEARLRERARRRGLSVEEEVREILREAVGGGDEGGHEPEMGLGSRIAARFRGIGLTQEEVRQIEKLRRAGAVRPMSFEE